MPFLCLSVVYLYLLVCVYLGCLFITKAGWCELGVDRVAEGGGTMMKLR